MDLWASSCSIGHYTGPIAIVYQTVSTEHLKGTVRHNTGLESHNTVIVCTITLHISASVMVYKSSVMALRLIVHTPISIRSSEIVYRSGVIA